MTQGALDDEGRVRSIVRALKTVAVLGAHEKPERPAHYVPAYLHEKGVEILPVNPRFAGRELFGREVVATLAELGREVDLVDVFRPPAAIPGHLDDILAMSPPPPVVWLQLGIRHDDAAARMAAAGIEVVQDRCLLVDHRRYA